MTVTDEQTGVTCYYDAPAATLHYTKVQFHKYIIISARPLHPNLGHRLKLLPLHAHSSTDTVIRLLSLASSTTLGHSDTAVRDFQFCEWIHHCKPPIPSKTHDVFRYINDRL